jgi:hypothetical protein
MRHVRSVASASAVLLVTWAAVSALAQEEARPKREAKRPSLSLKATPGTGMVPVRITAAAEFRGGDDDFEEYYCPTIEWNWDDGTLSESSTDCEPYQAGESQIRRRYSMSHTYKRPGSYRVSFRLKNKDKIVAGATAMVRLLGNSPY